MREAINNLPSPWNVFAWIGVVIFFLIISIVLVKINKLIFKNVRKKNDNNFAIVFIERLINIGIFLALIILGLSSIGGFSSVLNTVVGGTAIFSAVLAYVAQDIIKDILAGIVIGMHRPFEKYLWKTERRASSTI